MEETSKDHSDSEFMDYLFALLLKREQAYLRYERIPSPTNFAVYIEIRDIVKLLNNALTVSDHPYMWN